MKRSGAVPGHPPWSGRELGSWRGGQPAVIRLQSAPGGSSHIMDGPGHIQPKLRGQIMSKRAPIHATWAVCAPPGRMSGCPGHRGPGLNVLALGYRRPYGTFIRLSGAGRAQCRRGSRPRPFGIIAFDFPERAGGILLPTTIARIEKAARKAWRLPIKVPLPTAPVRYRRSAKTTITMSTMSTSVPMPIYTGASLPLNC